MLSSGLIASVAWFEPRTNAFSARISGSVVEEYFHCGKGTQNEPFVITRPVHYYHLTEFFQRETVLNVSSTESVTFGTDYLYFQVGYPLKENDSSLYVYDYDNTGSYTGTISTPAYSKTLNLSYFSGQNALMPIGTNEVPFFGSFDGGAQSNAANGITISNLNIKTSDTVVVNNVTTNRSTSDVGIFGYVADQKDSTHKTVIANAYFDNLTIDLSGASGTVVSDATHVDAHTNNEIYVGYIVGHIHTYTNYDSTGPTNAAPIHDVYVNNATIQGGATANSHFGYVGFADTIDGVPGSEFELADMIDALEAAAGPGQGPDWGGSIDFKEFNSRFYNHRNDFTYSSKKKLANYSTNYTKTSLAYGSNISTNILGKDPTTNTGKIVYNLQGSGSHTMGTGSNADTYTLVGTAMPIAIDSNGETLSRNTGYIVSSSRTTSTSANGSVRSASYRNGYLNNSLSDTAKTPREVYTAGSNTGELLTYDRTKTEILTNKNKTYNSSGTGKDNFVLIKDDMDGYNSGHTPSNSNLSGYTKNNSTVPGNSGLNLQKYNSSRAALDTLLDSSVTKKVQGIHFMNATIAANQTETLPIVKINGSTYSNSSYPLLKNCIDFNTKTNGIINFFAGAYYDQTVNGQYVAKADCFFSLYSVDRNPTTNAINSVKLISKIYKDTRAGNRYIYQYSDSTYSDDSSYLGDICFDMQYLWSEPPVQNALYYFEIPVDAGEFALGGVSGQDGGAYLLYLDLSANAGGEDQSYDTENKIADEPIFTQMEYVSSGYIINSCFNIGYAVPAGATKENFWIKVSRSGDIFAVEVVNQTSNYFDLHVLLVDDDDDSNNTYPYTYTLKYNGGSVSAAYGYSASFRGAVNGTYFTELI